MTDIKNYPKGNTRQIMDFNRFLSLTGTKELICLDRGVIEVARYLLNSRGLWRTSYAVSWNDYSYTMPTEEQFNILENAIAEGNIDMSSCTEIAEELANIRMAIQQQECCGTSSGSRGSGTTQQAPNPYNQDETPTEPPPGFESMELFNAHKCNQAQDILNNLKADLLGLSGIIYSGQSPTGLVGAIIVFLLTPIPFDDLVALLGYLIFTGYNYTFLATIAGEIDSDNDNLLCVLYNSASAEAAKANLLAEIEALANAVFTLPEDADWTVEAVEYMLTYDSFNRMFTDTPTVSQDADCSGCDVCEPMGTYDFETDLQGWSKITTSCIPLSEAGTTNVVHDGEEMRMTSTVAGAGLRAVMAISPSINQVVDALHQIQVTGYRNNGNNTFVRIEAEFTTAGCIGLTPTTNFNSATPITRTVLLTDYAGDTLETITIYINNSVNQDVDVSITEVTINCQ